MGSISRTICVVIGEVEPKEISLSDAPRTKVSNFN
jgi:hypothetical protein